MISTKKLCKFSHGRSAEKFSIILSKRLRKNKHFIRIPKSYDSLTNMILATHDCG